MNAISIEGFDNKGINIGLSDIPEKLKAFNKGYHTSVESREGFYGTKTITRDNGVTIEVAKNDIGQISKDYYQEGKIYQNKLKLGEGLWERTKFDDNGNPYIKETIKFGKNQPKEFSSNLAPDTRIVKGNFEAITDSYGRPILNTVKDLQLKDSGRENLNVTRTSEYRRYDERSHLIGDSLGGPASEENIVAQMKDVNRGKFAEVERIVRRLKRENANSKIDYSVKTNYADKSKRPSSFEPEITIDGEKYELSNLLKKIYNEPELSKLGKGKLTAKEMAEKIRPMKKSGAEKIRPMKESGLETGKTAAMITFAVSTVDNISQFARGEITAEEMVVDIAKETGEAGAIGYGTGFISTAISRHMLQSGCNMIRSLGGKAIPAAVISFGVTSFESINNFATGEIDFKELAYELGENGIGVTGSIEGSKYGAMAGTAIGGVPGAVVGGLVGGMVGYAVTTEVYATIVENGGDGAKEIATKAQELASSTYETVKEVASEKATLVRDSMIDYADKAGLSISL